MPGKFFRRIRQSQSVSIACQITAGVSSVSGKRLQVKRGQTAKSVP